jgi:hypothetical protein
VLLDYKKIFHGKICRLFYNASLSANDEIKMPAGMFYYKFDSPVVKYGNKLDINELNV